MRKKSFLKAVKLNSLLFAISFSVFLISGCGGEAGAGWDKDNREKWFAQCREIQEKMDECILNIQDPNDQAAGRACTDEYKNNLDKLHREHGKDPDKEVVEGCPIP